MVIDLRDIEEGREGDHLTGGPSKRGCPVPERQLPIHSQLHLYTGHSKINYLGKHMVCDGEILGSIYIWEASEEGK